MEGKFKQQRDNWVNDLAQTKTISVSRSIDVNPKEQIIECELHGFGDASTEAYCAVVYLVYRTNNKVYSELLTSRSRVALLQTLTIPRLELMAGRILAKLMSTVKEALQSQIKFDNTYYWLDSKTALCWIKNRGEWKQFVRHRVNEILDLSNKNDWRHCPGADNPADIGSRGVLASTLKEEMLWWHGPPWLNQPKDNWPKNENNLHTAESETEKCKSVVAMVAGVENSNNIAQIIDINRYNKLAKVVKVTALVLRYVNILRNNKVDKATKKPAGALSREELGIMDNSSAVSTATTSKL